MITVVCHEGKPASPEMPEDVDDPPDDEEEIEGFNIICFTPLEYKVEPLTQYGENRRCVECGARLSRCNHRTECQCHWGR
jgi:hypothetical protein